MPYVLLCIDDRPAWLQRRRMTFEALGYSVVTATDPRLAVDVLESISVDAVIVEYKREGIDAEAIALHIKNRFPKQPIILLSAYPELPDRTLWLVDDYLMNSQLDLLPESIARVTRESHETQPAA